MKNICICIGAFLLTLAAGLTVAVMTKKCGGSDFLAGGFAVTAGRAVWDIIKDNI